MILIIAALVIFLGFRILNSRKADQERPWALIGTGVIIAGIVLGIIASITML